MARVGSWAVGAASRAGLLVAVAGLGTGPAAAVQATSDYAIVHAFTEGTGAFQPDSALVLAPDGDYYGVTFWGGDPTSCGGSGCGTVYRLAADGSTTVVHAFTGADGSHPQAALVVGPDGWLYGTTVGGGTVSTCADCGTIFKVSTGAAFQSLHAFDGTDGRSPTNALLVADDGNLYGGTSRTLFRVATDGSLTTLYRFGTAHATYTGNVVSGALVQGTDGMLYGATAAGGKSRRCTVPGGCGSVFRMTLQGVLSAYYDLGDSDGTVPESGFTIGRDGNFYLATTRGGDLAQCGAVGCGTVFRLTPALAHAVVHVFHGSDGAAPRANLRQGADGRLYGTTSAGGPSSHCGAGCGSVFRMTLAGRLTTLHWFWNSTVDDGASPTTALAQRADGTLLGTTFGGSGTLQGGTVYGIAP